MKRYFLIILVTFSLGAVEFVVEAHGETYVVDMDEGQALLDVQEQIAECVDLPVDQQVFIVAKNDTIAKKATSKARNYEAPVSSKEKKDIAYIVNTLAEKSLLSLLGYKSSLVEAGDRVNHVHPLRFLMCIFTDDQLKGGIKAIKDRGGWVWGDFIGGLSDSFSEEYKRSNVTDKQVKDFAKAVGVNPDLILPAVHKKKWSDFVGTLIKNVPKKKH